MVNEIDFSSFNWRWQTTNRQMGETISGTYKGYDEDKIRKCDRDWPKITRLTEVVREGLFEKIAMWQSLGIECSK